MVLPYSELMVLKDFLLLVSNNIAESLRCIAMIIDLGYVFVFSFFREESKDLALLTTLPLFGDDHNQHCVQSGPLRSIALQHWTVNNRNDSHITWSRIKKCFFLSIF